jgi:hypothetical protein
MSAEFFARLVLKGHDHEGDRQNRDHEKADDVAEEKLEVDMVAAEQPIELTAKETTFPFRNARGVGNVKRGRHISPFAKANLLPAPRAEFPSRSEKMLIC